MTAQRLLGRGGVLVWIDFTQPGDFVRLLVLGIFRPPAQPARLIARDRVANPKGFPDEVKYAEIDRVEIVPDWEKWLLETRKLSRHRQALVRSSGPPEDAELDRLTGDPRIPRPDLVCGTGILSLLT